jgi:hypothetical protein
VSEGLSQDPRPCSLAPVVSASPLCSCTSQQGGAIVGLKARAARLQRTECLQEADPTEGNDGQVQRGGRWCDCWSGLLMLDILFYFIFSTGI